MKPRTLLIAVLVVLGTATCVRLGFWQLSRLAEKKRLNAALRESLASPPFAMRGAVPAGATHRKVALEGGGFDESVQVLLAGRSKSGSPGVHVVTPYRLEGGTVVLVDRGWLYAPDAATARPQDHREKPGRAVVGLADPITRHGRGAGGIAWRALERDSVTLWSARALDPDSLAAHLPWAVAPFVVRELPGPGVPAGPAREEPKPLDETMHLSYAIQWFLFGSILLFGSMFLARSRRRPVLLAPPAPELPSEHGTR